MLGPEDVNSLRDLRNDLLITDFLKPSHFVLNQSMIFDIRSNWTSLMPQATFPRVNIIRNNLFYYIFFKIHEIYNAILFANCNFCPTFWKAFSI